MRDGQTRQGPLLRDPARQQKGDRTSDRPDAVHKYRSKLSLSCHVQRFQAQTFAAIS